MKTDFIVSIVLAVSVCSISSFNIDDRRNKVKTHPHGRSLRSPRIIIDDFGTSTDKLHSESQRPSYETDITQLKSHFGPKLQDRISQILPADNVHEQYKSFKKNAYDSINGAASHFSHRNLDFGHGAPGLFNGFDNYEQAVGNNDHSVEVEFANNFDTKVSDLDLFDFDGVGSSFETSLPLGNLDTSGEKRDPDNSAEQSNEEREPEYIESEDLSA